MKKYLVAVLIIILSSSIHAEDISTIPKFENYAAEIISIEHNAKIKISKSDRPFETKLKKANKEKPNFAGHYIMALWGCGHTCINGAIIDALTGEIYTIPLSVCCWGPNVKDDFEPFEFRIDSKLFICRGFKDETDKSVIMYYLFDDGNFILLREEPWLENGWDVLHSKGKLENRLQSD